MNIRAATYFSRTRMSMGGPNILELSYFQDLQVHDRVPIPAVLDYQLDYLAIRYMTEQMHMITKRLKHILFAKNNFTFWYEIYLTTFVLLCSLETVHAKQIEILDRFAAKVCPFNSQSHKLIISAKTQQGRQDSSGRMHKFDYD